MEAQTHRRFVKTHLPVEALVYSPKAKYLYIGRDGRDVLWSLYNHHAMGNEAMYDALNNSPGRVGPPLEPPPDDIREYWHTWLAKDGFPYWSFWENVRSWWAIRKLPNIMMVHFDVLKRHMPEEMRRIAKFLDIPIDESKWDLIVEHCTFDWMKEHGEKIVPLGSNVEGRHKDLHQQGHERPLEGDADSRGIRRIRPRLEGERRAEGTGSARDRDHGIGSTAGGCARQGRLDLGRKMPTCQRISCTSTTVRGSTKTPSAATAPMTITAGDRPHRRGDLGDLVDGRPSPAGRGPPVLDDRDRRGRVHARTEQPGGDTGRAATPISTTSVP